MSGEASERVGPASAPIASDRKAEGRVQSLNSSSSAVDDGVLSPSPGTGRFTVEEAYELKEVID